MKTLDLDKSILELTEEYPELIEIMKSLGFKEIANPVIRRTAGRAMTIPKGCEMRGADLEKVKKAFEAEGFNIGG